MIRIPLRLIKKEHNIDIGDSSFISIPYNSTVGCDQWCCVNSYEKSTYYPCREKTINQWVNGLNLKTVIVPNPTNGIIRGL